MKTRKGFSLLEMLIVIAAVGILLGVGATSLQGYQRRLRLNEAGQAVTEGIRRASDDSLRQSRTVTLTVENSNQTLIWREGTAEVGRQNLPAGATVTMTKQIPSSPATFTMRGLPSQQLTFTVARGGMTQTIILLVTGLVIQP